jgi:hypothetical protein
MKQLMSTGNYDSSAAGAQKLLTDTEKAAGVYGLIYGFAQFVGPGAPNARLLAKAVDPDSGYVETNVVSYFLSNEANKLAREYAEANEPPHKALQALFERYGPNVYLYAVSNSVSKYPGTETSPEWWDWYRVGTNKEFVLEFQTVGAFFGAAGSDFDDEALETRNQLTRNGLIRPKTPEELAEEGRLDLVFYQYNLYRDQMPEERFRTPQQRIALAAYADTLERVNGVLLNDATSRQRRQKQLDELERMFTDYKNSDLTWASQLESDVGWAVMTYMEFRRQAQEQGVTRFGLENKDSWATSNAGAALRDGIRSVGEKLSQGYEWRNQQWVKVADSNPGFARLYSYVLEREMTGEFDLDGDVLARFIAADSSLVESPVGG